VTPTPAGRRRARWRAGRRPGVWAGAGRRRGRAVPGRPVRRDLDRWAAGAAHPEARRRLGVAGRPDLQRTHQAAEPLRQPRKHPTAEPQDRGWAHRAAVPGAGQPGPPHQAGPRRRAASRPTGPEPRAGQAQGGRMPALPIRAGRDPVAQRRADRPQGGRMPAVALRAGRGPVGQRRAGRPQAARPLERHEARPAPAGPPVAHHPVKRPRTADRRREVPRPGGRDSPAYPAKVACSSVGAVPGRAPAPQAARQTPAQAPGQAAAPSAVRQTPAQAPGQAAAPARAAAPSHPPQRHPRHRDPGHCRRSAAARRRRQHPPRVGAAEATARAPRRPPTATSQDRRGAGAAEGRPAREAGPRPRPRGHPWRVPGPG
jgi:hypothetical protein